jgi:mRNA m6A methyltransferase catalytic subunit
MSTSTRDDILGILNHSLLTNTPSFATDESVVTCRYLTEEDCQEPAPCLRRHFKRLIRATTESSAGLCSYMNLCKNPDCKFVHLEDKTDDRSVSSSVAPPGSQWIRADVRQLDMSQFKNRVAAVLMDPPWDIHMELDYGTMTDDEMRNLQIGDIHDGGFIFLWATTRTLELARECLHRWGYHRAEEIIWVKTNQIGGTVRSGRTGHWFNHSKEHCLVGVKGDVSWSKFGKYRVDCDVIVSPVRENSRKADELYGIIERLVEGSGKPCLELFGRNHNRRPNWITVGNQLE